VKPHELKRCGWCEADLDRKLAHPGRDFVHVDEICIQAYLDLLGVGINTQLRQ